MIATRLAFRGIEVDPASLANVAIAETAQAFVAALRNIAPGQRDAAPRAISPMRRFYEARFSPAAYKKSLARLVGPLLGSRSAVSA